MNSEDRSAEASREKSQGSVNREMILQGAAELFSKSGYSAASIEDIASHTRLTEEQIYGVFASKNAIGEAVIRRQHELTLGVGQRIFVEKRPAMEQLMMATTEAARQLVTQPIVRAGLRLSTESSMFFPDYVKVPYFDWIENFASVFRTGIAEGDVDSAADPQELGRLIVNMFVGTQVVSGVLSNWEDLFVQLPLMWKRILPSFITRERQDELVPKLIALVK